MKYFLILSIGILGLIACGKSNTDGSELVSKINCPKVAPLSGCPAGCMYVASSSSTIPNTCKVPTDEYFGCKWKFPTKDGTSFYCFQCDDGYSSNPSQPRVGPFCLLSRGEGYGEFCTSVGPVVDALGKYTGTECTSCYPGRFLDKTKEIKDCSPPHEVNLPGSCYLASSKKSKDENDYTCTQCNPHRPAVLDAPALPARILNGIRHCFKLSIFASDFSPACISYDNPGSGVVCQSWCVDNKIVKTAEKTDLPCVPLEADLCTKYEFNSELPPFSAPTCTTCQDGSTLNATTNKCVKNS